MTEINTIPSIENPQNAESKLRALLSAGRGDAALDDFGVTSMFCGSGRTPQSQNWPLEHFKNNAHTFRYKDTLITVNPESGNLEIVTYGPGTGRKVRSPVDSMTGKCPTIEEMRDEQKEILQMVAKIRKEMNQANPAIEVLPQATVIGFSRGAVAVQHASVAFVPEPLLIIDATSPDAKDTSDRIEITAANGSLEYTVYLAGKETSHGLMTQENLSNCGIDISTLQKPISAETLVALQMHINRFLLNKGEAGVGERALLDSEKTLFVSLDAVAGRVDPGNDHRVNPNCHGIYVMSTNLQPEYRPVAFGATNPRGAGENWSQLTMDGPHGAVFDNPNLRAVILGVAARGGSFQDRESEIRAAVRTVDRQALFASTVGVTGGSLSHSGFLDRIRMDPDDILARAKKKADAVHLDTPDFLERAARKLGFGRGEARLEARHRSFKEVAKQVEDFIEEVNTLREEAGLPTWESYLKAIKKVDESLNILDKYIKDRAACPEGTVAFRQRAVAIEALASLKEIRQGMTFDSSQPELEQAMEEMRSKINEIITNKASILQEKPATHIENKQGFTPLGTRIGLWGTQEVSNEPFDATALSGALKDIGREIGELLGATDILTFEIEDEPDLSSDVTVETPSSGSSTRFILEEIKTQPALESYPKRASPTPSSGDPDLQEESGNTPRTLGAEEIEEPEDINDNDDSSSPRGPK